MLSDLTIVTLLSDTPTFILAIFPLSLLFTVFTVSYRLLSSMLSMTSDELEMGYELGDEDGEATAAIDDKVPS